MGGRLTRFLNLERARKPDLTPPHGVANTGRFTGEPPPAASPEDLFRAERATQLDSGVEIDAVADGEQPFTRCPVCEADNSKFAVRCINCQAPLDTEEAREWNRRLWAERLKQRALEPQPAPLPPSQQAEQQIGEMLAQQVAERERSRWAVDDQSDDRRPIGMKLLELIPDPNVRFGAAMGLVGAFFTAGLVAFAAKQHPGLQVAGTIVAVALLILFLPGRRRRNSWWWNGD